MFRDDLDRIKEDIKLGFMYRDIDESYANGVWDLAIKYVKKHHLNNTHALSPQDVDIITNVLYDFIYDLLEEDLNDN